MAGVAQGSFGATVVGEPTAGINKLKELLELDSRRALVLSTAQWETANQKEFHGIEPDVLCRVSAEDASIGRNFYRLSHFVLNFDRDKHSDPQLFVAYAESLKKCRSVSDK